MKNQHKAVQGNKFSLKAAATCAIILLTNNPVRASYDITGMLSESINFVNSAGPWKLLAQIENSHEQHPVSFEHRQVASAIDHSMLLAQIEGMLEPSESSWMAIIDLVQSCELQLNPLTTLKD